MMPWNKITSNIQSLDTNIETINNSDGIKLDVKRVRNQQSSLHKLQTDGLNKDISALSKTRPTPSSTEKLSLQEIRQSPEVEIIQDSQNCSAKKQTFKNSCGAVSLLCAAKELGCTEVPVLKGSISEAVGIATLELDNRCESDIYRLTSGGTLGPNPVANLADAGYSLPHNIILASRLLGLEPTLYMEPRFASKVLAYCYSNVVSHCQNSGVPINKLKSPQLQQNERDIQLLVSNLAGIPAGLHWVMTRPDGSFMDPATGKNQANFHALNQGAHSVSRFAGYTNTGITID